MARRKSWWKKILFGSNREESYSGLILGAIIVVILGLLVANYFSKKNLQPSSEEEISQIQGENQQSSQELEYKVEPNDSLSAISMKYYGTFDYWPVLASVNNIANPNLIYKDTTIKVPSKSEAEQLKAQMSITSYEIQPGDTLFTIAMQVYGDGSKWTLLDRVNKVGRLPNGNSLIFAGNKLVIPR